MPVKNKPPKYIRLGSETGTAMRFHELSDGYWRDAGQWAIGYKFDNGFFSIHQDEQLNNLPLIPISEEEYLKDNEGYV